jgi:cation diffusion facilitator CzcD-associated flavoprotein CzcO
MESRLEHVDVLIVGAGLSGIGAAWHLQDRCPGKSYAILEARDAIGGTWDLFRYPGIRSDSDMHTLGYRFRPWTQAKAIADGPSIRQYVRDTAREAGIDRHIRFHHRVRSASWSSDKALWTITAEHDGNAVVTTASFLFFCSGYYSYDEAYRPTWEDEGDFKGQIIHPQFWPEELDYAGKQVVVIGSGATAVTLVPEMARTAGHVTMLQRSPTYIASRPGEDSVANRLRRIFPSGLAYSLTRWKNVLFQLFFFRMARKRPAKVKERLVGMVRAQLGPDYDVATHFTPTYNPWDQRLCLVPDADLFEALKRGRASVATDHIERFTAEGIVLKSGKVLPADIIVTATGLKLNILGNIQVSIDGRAVDPSKELTYKGMMLSDVPNAAFAFGYTNASWTLKADLTSEFVCRTLNYMDKRGVKIATPVRTDLAMSEEPYLDFNSGYVQRALDILPKQGGKAPWKLNQNYALDLMTLRFGKIDDGTMRFSNPVAGKKAA